VTPRVRGNLAYLEKRRKVTKDVGETGVVWALA
jgi:hypothetical protein